MPMYGYGACSACLHWITTLKGLVCQIYCMVLELETIVFEFGFLYASKAPH